MKLSPAASRIAQPNCSVDWTKIGAQVLGSRCQRSMRQRRRADPDRAAIA